MTLADAIYALHLTPRPSPELDSTIAQAVGWRVGEMTATGLNWHEPPADWPGEFAAGWWPPSFTSSLDAARTLLPKGWVIGSLEDNPYARYAGITLHEVDERGTYDARIRRRVQFAGETAEIALCLAALEARRIMEGTK